MRDSPALGDKEVNLEALTQAFVEETGRVDLVTDYDGSVFTDNGAYKLLRRGCKLLDQLYGEIKGKETKTVTLTSGETQVWPRLLRVPERLFLDLGAGSYQVEGRNLLVDEQKNSTAVTLRTAGSPAYYSFIRQGVHEAIPLGITMPALTNNPNPDETDASYPNWRFGFDDSSSTFTWLPGGLLKTTFALRIENAYILVPVTFKGDLKSYTLEVKGILSSTGPCITTIQAHFFPGSVSAGNGEVYFLKALVNTTTATTYFKVGGPLLEALFSPTNTGVYGETIDATPFPPEYLAANLTQAYVRFWVKAITADTATCLFSRFSFAQKGSMLQLDSPIESAGTASVYGQYWEEPLITSQDTNFWTENFSEEVILAASYFLELQMRNRTGAQEKLEALKQGLLGSEMDAAENEVERDNNGCFILEG